MTDERKVELALQGIAGMWNVTEKGSAVLSGFKGYYYLKVGDPYVYGNGGYSGQEFRTSRMYSTIEMLHKHRGLTPSEQFTIEQALKLGYLVPAD